MQQSGRFIVAHRDRTQPGPPAFHDDIWCSAPVAEINQFHDRSSSHRPTTTARLLYDDMGLFGRFDVADQYVLARYTLPQSMVCEDSCVEFFFQPDPDAGYFNFEFNALGTTLTFYITDPMQPEQPPNQYLSVRHLSRIKTRSTLTQPILQEIATPLQWSLAFSIDWALFDDFLPGCRVPPKQATCNFFKCADHSSHPHWASWSNIGERLHFHQPARFAPMHFDAATQPR